MSDAIENIKRKTMSSFLWKFCERIFAQLVSFVVSVVLARILMPDEYGVIALVTIFISLADVLVTNGLGVSLVQRKDADDVAFNTLFYVGLFLSIVLYAVLYLSAPIVAKIYRNNLIIPVLRVMGLRIPIAAVNAIQHALVSKKLDFKKFFFSTFWGTVVSGVVGIGLALNGFGVWALVAQYLTNTIIDTIVLFFTVNWRPKFVFSFDRLRNLLSFGCKLMLTGFIGVFFNQLKSLIIGAKYSSTDLAYYNRGEKIPILISGNIETTIDSVLFPALSLVQNDNEKVVKGIRRFLKIGSYIIMPLMFGLAVTGDTVIRLLLTEKWIMSVPYLQIVCIQQVFSILNTANLQVLKAKGQGNALVKLEFIKKPVLLIILLITVQLGPMAIVIGVAVYEVIAAVINSIPTRKLVQYGIGMQLKDILPNMIISLIMCGFVYLIGLLKLNDIILFVLQVVLGIGIYILCSVIFKNESFYYLIRVMKKKSPNK